MDSKNYGNRVMQAVEIMAELITLLLKSDSKTTRVLVHAMAHQLHIIKNLNQAIIQQLWLFEQKNNKEENMTLIEITKDTIIVQCAWCGKIIRDLRPLWKKLLRIKEKNRISHAICDGCMRNILSYRWDNPEGTENRLEIN